MIEDRLSVLAREAEARALSRQSLVENRGRPYRNRTRHQMVRATKVHKEFLLSRDLIDEVIAAAKRANKKTSDWVALALARALSEQGKEET